MMRLEQFRRRGASAGDDLAGRRIRIIGIGISTAPSAANPTWQRLFLLGKVCRRQREKSPYWPSATTGLRSTPNFSIETSTVSPGCKKTGGWRAIPTPGGVPVKIKSPGSSVHTCER